MKSESASCCLICEEPLSEGISILNRFICRECEEEIVGVLPSQPGYCHLVERIRLLWRNISLEQLS